MRAIEEEIAGRGASRGNWNINCACLSAGGKVHDEEKGSLGSATILSNRGMIGRLDNLSTFFKAVLS